MPLYRSSTRELAVRDLPPALLSKLREHAGAHQLSLDEGSRRCWLTRSENPLAEGFFGRLLGRRSNPADDDAEHVTAVLLLPKQLVVGVYGERRGASAMSLALARASIGTMSAFAEKVGGVATEPGMNVTGFPGEMGRPGSFFVKLGEEAAGLECRAAVEAAVRAAKSS